MSSSSKPPEPQAGASLLAELDALARMSEPGPGVTRLAYSPEDVRARGWFKDQCAAVGLRFAVDQDGTCYGFSPTAGDVPGVVLGSHLDSVVHGGRYDGTVGVVTAFEVARRVLAHQPQARITVLAFACEESVRFGIGTIGSRILMGELGGDELASLATMDGIAFADLVASAGLADASARIPPERFIGSYVEVHIDQGSELVHRDVGIGIVDAVAGVLRTEMTWLGEASHAGAHTRAMRRDALLAVAEFVLALDGLWERRQAQGEPVVLTVGKLDVSPNSPNTVAGEVRIVVDLRCPDPEILHDCHTAVHALAAEISQRRGIALRAREFGQLDPVRLDEGLAATLTDSAVALGIPTTSMISLAGHDAMVVGKRHPAALLFVRNPAAVSHSPQEDVDPQALDDVVRLLVHALPRLDERRER